MSGVPVRQHVRKAGDVRLEWEFELGETRESVWFVTAGQSVDVAANLGTREQDRLRLPPGTRKFTVTVSAK